MTLREFLFYEGISNKEFAEMIKVSPTAVHGWVHGKAVPRPRHVRAIREATNDRVDIWSFYRNERSA